jgi:LysM repeat protein
MTFEMPELPQKLKSRLAAIRPGAVVRGFAIPMLAAAVITAGFPGLGNYRVQRGDTLTEIAQKYGTTVRNLVRINDLPGNGDLIYAGETLKVPVRAKPRPGPKVRIVVYNVKPGDTISRLAHRYHIRMQALLAANGLRPSSRIYAGHPLRIPLPVPKKKPDTKRTYPAKVRAAAARNRETLRHRTLPTRSAMRRIIVATARRHGVDPYLALAVGWQESGWKQRVVSEANAIGTMQVLPSSGRFSSDIIGRRLDLLRPRDNVTAGVVLLDWLCRAASEPNAIAGYYQGLGSVRKRGMYTDTKRYVANVQLLKRRLEQGWDPLR